MEREPVFGGYERDPIMPEVKPEKGFEARAEKKDKKKKNRDWREARESRDKRENREYAAERDGVKVKRTGEGVLGLAGKEAKDNKTDGAATKLGPEALGAVVANGTEAPVAESPHDFKLPMAETPAANVSPEAVDGAAASWQHTEGRAENADNDNDAGLPADGEPVSVFERVAAAARKPEREPAEDDVVVAELLDDESIAEEAPETRDIVDAEVIETPPSEKAPEASSALPATTASAAQYVYARPRAASGGGGGAGHGGGSGGGSGGGHGGGTGGAGPFGGGPTGHGGTAGAGHHGAPFGGSGYNAAAFNTVPIPVPVDKDPFAYQRGKRRGLGQGLLAGGVGGWLLGRRGGKKKLAAAERQHAAKTAEQNKRIKQLEFEQANAQTAESPAVAEAQPATRESPRPAMERVLAMGGAAATAEAQPHLHTEASPAAHAERPIIETMASQKLPEQAMGAEADSKVREDVHEKLDRPQDQGGLVGGGAAATGPAAAAGSSSHHVGQQPHVGPVHPHDPVARSVLQARKDAHRASQQAMHKAKMQILGLVGAIVAVLAFIIFQVAA